MTEQTNRIGELFGVDGNNTRAVQRGQANSALSYVNSLVGTYDDVNYAVVYETGFSGATIPAGLTLTEEGTTTAAATYSGQATMTSDDVAAKSDQLTTPLSWKPANQVDKPLIFQCRWKTGATITASEYWIGLTDASPDTDPIALSTTSTFTTSEPTDGVYLGYSATPTSGAAFTTGGNQHTAISISTNTNTIVASGGGKFLAATYYIYRFEIDANGTCRYYVNGNLLGTQAAAVDPTKALCAMVCATPRTTVSAAITCKSILVAGAGA